MKCYCELKTNIYMLRSDDFDDSVTAKRENIKNTQIYEYLRVYYYECRLQRATKLISKLLYFIVCMYIFTRVIKIGCVC